MCIAQTFEIIASVATVAGAVISVCVFNHSVKRERRILTIDNFSKFREKYPLEISAMTDIEKIDYLRDIEYFCIGVNNKIYDFKILQKMSGKRLLGQYQKEMKVFLENRREIQDTDKIWNEYEKVMQRLECHYCSNKNWIQKIICRKRS